MVKINKKIITAFTLIFSMITVCGIVFAFQGNSYQKADNKDLLKEFGSAGIGSVQINKDDKIGNSENQKRTIAQEINFIARIGKQFFGIEKKIFFRPINKMVELKNYQAPKTINVPKDYSKIQEAIDNANFGDTIKVASGEYLENIIMKEGLSLIGSNVLYNLEDDKSSENTKKSENIFEEESTQITISETIINGEKSGNVVSFKNGITNKTKLVNFTIKNSGENLSGILIENSSPLIKDNILKDNEYGVYIKGNSSPVIQKNIINFNNKGIQVYNFEEKAETKETLDNIAFDSVPSSTVIDNLITDNKIGVDLYNSSATIDHNTISYNNHYKTYLGPTFGIYIAKSSAEITNNIITDNGICDLCAGINADEESKNVTMSYNNIWGNKNNFVCFGECVMENNNLSEDPKFINCVTGDFKLKEESGLIGMCGDGSDMGVRW